MRVLLHTIAQTGAPATESTLEVAALRLGRGTDQDVLLADLRVALAHAEIVARKSLLGAVAHIETKARLPLWINGRQSSGDDLRIGDVIELGRYRLTVMKARAGFDLALQLEERFAAQDERQQRRKTLRLSLQQVGFSKRGWAWGLFLLVLIPGLLLPLWFAQRAPATPDISRERALPAGPGFDILWNSGPLSSAHHVLQNDCKACHVQPFAQVSDASCTGCHNALGNHASSVEVAAQAPFAEQQCTDCHREHNGLTGLTPREDAACTSCHADPSALPGAKLLPVKDFTQSHPAFSLALARQDGKNFVWQEFRQDSAQAKRQDTGLKFPHDVHLSAKGIAGPDGNAVLECASCHTPNADRSSFLPTQMETHCASCHRLDFDAAAPDHELPHGKPEQVVRIVRDYYKALALTGVAPPLATGQSTVKTGPDARQRPDDPRANAPAPIGRTAAWAEARAETALRDVFERRTCFYCHAVTSAVTTDGQPAGPPEARWQIAPVAAQRTALKGSAFPHSAHGTESCTSCHAAETSKASEDVLLPDIGSCRECHGDTGAMTETPSSCQSCHGYHSHPLVAPVASLLPAAPRP